MSEPRFIDRLNAKAAEELHEEAQQARERTLRLSSKVLRRLLEDQILDFQTAGPGTRVELKVTQEDEFTPTAPEGTLVSCLTFSLENVALPEPRERLRILLPIKDDLDIGNLAAVQAMPEADTMYTERSMPAADGEVRVVGERYAITTEMAFPYVSDADEVQGQTNDQALIDFLSRRVMVQSAMLGQLREDMVNWTAVPQRYTVQGSPDVHDL
jgi:hypothetical protein